MKTLTEVESKFKQTCCPKCYYSDLNITLQCKSRDPNCIWLCHCRHCGHDFQLNQTSKTVQAIYLGVESTVSSSECSHCGASGGTAKFLCNLATKDCFISAECSTCKGSYEI
jgi:hypothetical protein